MSVGGKVEVCARAASGAATRNAQTDAVRSRADCRRSRSRFAGEVELEAIIWLFLPGIVPSVGDITVTTPKRFRAVIAFGASTTVSAV
jgi:hypothetical protein